MQQIFARIPGIREAHVDFLLWQYALVRPKENAGESTAVLVASTPELIVSTAELIRELVSIDDFAWFAAICADIPDGMASRSTLSAGRAKRTGNYIAKKMHDDERRLIAQIATALAALRSAERQMLDNLDFAIVGTT